MEVEEVIPEVRKAGKKQQPAKPPARRVRGELSKKEETEMMKKHRDIAGMLAHPPTKEATNHERRIAKEVEMLESVDEEREERLERLRRRKLEWQDRKAQKAVIMNVKDLEDESKVAKVMEIPETAECHDGGAHTIAWPSDSTTFQG